MRLRDEKGISIVGTIMTLILLGVMGAALVALVATDQESRMAAIRKARAFYAVQACFEYALKEIKEGGYPIVASKQFDDTTFTSTIEPVEKKITCVGQSGDAARTHSITTSLLGADCLTVDVAGANLGGMGNELLQGITLTQTCLNAVRVESIIASWSPDVGERVQEVEIGGSVVYDDAMGVASDQLIDINDYRITGSVSFAMEFSADMSDRIVTLTFNLTDSSEAVSAKITL